MAIVPEFVGRTVQCGADSPRTNRLDGGASPFTMVHRELLSVSQRLWPSRATSTHPCAIV